MLIRALRDLSRSVETSNPPYQTAMALYRDNKNRQGEGIAFGGLGLACFSLGQYKKEKYQTTEDHPLAKLVRVGWKGRSEVPNVELPKQEFEETANYRTKAVSTKHAHSLSVRVEFELGNNNETDFTYALALFRRGMDRDEVEQRIFSERDDWRHHKGENAMRDYFKRTLDKAERVIKNSTSTQRQSGRWVLGRSLGR